LITIRFATRISQWGRDLETMYNLFDLKKSVTKIIKRYQKKWLQHVQRMETNRLPKQALIYRPKGRRNIGRPKKRWRDRLHFEDQGTGNTPNPS
jgi:hypothetical protein